MYRVTRERTVQRSHDPSEYTIVAFGGVGPMCATDVAGGLDAPRVSVSPSPGIVPARRLLTADVKYDSQVTLGRDIAGVEAETVERQFEEPGQWSRNRRHPR